MQGHGRGRVWVLNVCLIVVCHGDNNINSPQNHKVRVALIDSPSVFSIIANNV